MIEITRALARQMRPILRKSVPVRRGTVLLHVQAGADGLRLRAADPEVAVEYHRPQKLPPGQVVLPSEALSDFEGAREETVILEDTGQGTTQARWTDGGVPQVRVYPTEKREASPPFPAMPQRWYRHDPGLLMALRQAAATTGKGNARYSLERLQLRGAKGEIVATDGRQVLIQRGFTFSWKDDVLVPALAMYGCKELAGETIVAVGRTDTHVGLRVGPWTLLLAIDAHSKFPRADEAIPAGGGSVTKVQLDPSDSAFLTRTLPRLPGGSDEHAPLTLDLNGHVAVRARGEGQEQVTELVLGRSTVSGPPVRLVTNRLYLARAAALGFAGFDVRKADVPIVCRDEKRIYVWMPLGKDRAIAPSPDTLRIESTAESLSPCVEKPERREANVNPFPPNPNGTGLVATPRRKPASASDSVPAATTTGSNGLIEEAQALRDLLRDALVRVNQLLIAAKQQQRQSRLLRSTLAALKQLQNVQA